MKIQAVVEDRIVTISSYLDKICSELEQLDRVDPVTGAIYRKQAQDILADPSIALKVRVAIADLLSQANRRLAIASAGNDEESY
jgi:predicted metal-binding protein